MVKCAIVRYESRSAAGAYLFHCQRLISYSTYADLRNDAQKGNEVDEEHHTLHASCESERR